MSRNWQKEYVERLKRVKERLKEQEEAEPHIQINKGQLYLHSDDVYRNYEEIKA